MDKSKKRTLLIYPRAVRLISGLFFLGLVALDFVPQFGALFDGVADIFVVGAVLIFVCIWFVFEWDGVAYKGLVGYGIQDFLPAGC